MNCWKPVKAYKRWAISIQALKEEGSQTNSAMHFICRGYIMLYNDFENMIQKRKEDSSFNVSDEMEMLSEKYNVCVKTLYTRFNTYFGKSPIKYVKDSLTPSKDELDSLILNTLDVKELWGKLPRPYHFYNGIFDKFYGVSTYQKAKEVILSSQKTSNYNVTRADNRSLIYSQLLGDGSYDSKRHALRIMHGIKQAEYLKAKVSMLNKAYPKLSSKVTLSNRSQGHQVATWYSGNLGNVDIPNKEDYHTLISKLTPLGWLLWWLDDGGWYQNIAIFSKNNKIVETAIEVLKTYGIEARSCQNGFCMSGKANTIRFYKTFVEPLLTYIPSCMMYKVKI